MVTKSKKSTTSKKKDYTYSLGRRKTATARVRLYAKKTVPGSSNQLVVNGQSGAEYFPGHTNHTLLVKPFSIIGKESQFSFSAKVQGSGKSSQLDAVVHGLSRALAKYDISLRPELKKAGLLKRDSRKRERRKVGTGGKARRQKQSPKR